MGRPSSYTPEATKASIYGLTDPRDGALRYIGKANNPQKRFDSHMRDARRRDTPVYRWLRKLERLGLKPGLTVLEADCSDWKDSERRLIAEARQRGERLLNVADGGDEPACPIEVRRENGRKNNFKTRSELPCRGGKDTRESLILDTYNWLLKYAIRCGRTEKAEKYRAEMKQMAADDPVNFGAWA